MAKTTKKDFKLFKKECRKWIEVFGLKNWCVRYEHTQLNDCLANILWNTNGMTATIRLGTERPKLAACKTEIRRSAFHEVCHILLAKYYTIAQSRIITIGELDTVDHEIVRTLENTVFK